MARASERDRDMTTKLRACRPQALAKLPSPAKATAATPPWGLTRQITDDTPEELARLPQNDSGRPDPRHVDGGNPSALRSSTSSDPRAETGVRSHRDRPWCVGVALRSFSPARHGHSPGRIRDDEACQRQKPRRSGPRRRDRRYGRGVQAATSGPASWASMTTGTPSSTSPAVSRPAPARLSRPSCETRSRHRDRCSPSASTTAATPRRPAWSIPDVPATFTKFPAALAGPFDASRSPARHRLGGRARRRHRPARRPRRRSRRLGPRRRAHRRPGHQRPAAPVRGRRPVLPGQVPPGLRPARPVDRHPRRIVRPRRPRPRMLSSTARRCRTPGPATSSSASPG